MLPLPPYNPNDYYYMGMDQMSYINKEYAPENYPKPLSLKENKNYKTPNEKITENQHQYCQKVKQQQKSIQNQLSLKQSIPILKIQQKQFQIAQFHLSDKKDIANLFNYFHLQIKNYQNILSKLVKKDKNWEQTFKALDLKIKTFKKSKEQMIKIIIRRTQRHYKANNKCKRDQRFRKYGGFKSMNTVYLQNMFSDPLFLKAYEEVAVEFKQELERQNMIKLQNVLDHISDFSKIEQVSNLIQFLSEKNKMPWPSYWMQKMHKIIYQLYDAYSDRKPHITEKLRQNIESYSFYELD